MTTKYRRRAMSEFLAEGDRWLRAWIVVVILIATYGLVERIG